jgi:hypothetical protein
MQKSRRLLLRGDVHGDPLVGRLHHAIEAGPRPTRTGLLDFRALASMAPGTSGGRSCPRGRSSLGEVVHCALGVVRPTVRFVLESSCFGVSNSWEWVL